MKFLSTIIVALLTIGIITVVPLSSQTARLIRPSGGEVFRPGISEDLVWDTTGTFRFRWRFQFATSPSGPWVDLVGATSIIDSATRRGAFPGGFRIPANGTNTGYLRMIQINTDGTLNEANQSSNSTPFTISQPSSARIDSVLRDPIVGRVQLRRTKVYGIDGYVFVNNGGVLAIDPGTIIIGDTVGQNSAICVNRGGKIFANGRPDAPIVMTSSAPPGQRSPGNWGGLLMCGFARTNHPGGEAALEGGIADPQSVPSADRKGWFGGSDDNDSSGVVRYTRIEFAGISVAPNSELNSLTMGGVGRRTVLEYIQCSYGNDDSFEWFGGTVNAKYLISTGCLDDDFDTDNGFSGKVQFGLSQRLRDRADASTSQAFESDNDANASFNQPLTSVIFSNMTCIGPMRDTSWTIGNGISPNTFNSRFGTAAQIRRNSRMSLYNSLLIGYPRGIEIAQANTMNAANSDSLSVRNNIWFGIKGTWLNFAGGTPPTPMTTAWISTPQFSNARSGASTANLVNPFTTNNQFDPSPDETAGYLTNASFARSGIAAIDDPYFTIVPYVGAFARNERWDLPWAEYDPINRDYRASSPVRLTYPTGNERFTAGQSVVVRWDTLGTAGFTYKLQFATSKQGPWVDVNGLSSIIDGGQTRGSVSMIVPAISTQTGYLRLQSLTDELAFGINDVGFTITVPVIIPTARLIAPNGGETFRPGTSQDLRWDTTNTLSQRWKFQFATSQTGPWTDLQGAANILDSATRRGGFPGGFRVPAVATQTGYIRMVNLADSTITDVSDAPFIIDQPSVIRPDSVLRGAITNTVTLSCTKRYGVDGYVFVNNGGVLRIEPGTVITGDTVGQNSAICVNRGGKIYANGTAEKPIVMTSSAPVNQRQPGDWGGLLVCGFARTNHPGGEAALEGGIADPQSVPSADRKGWFGGSDDNDSSGVVRYTRIEFAGIAVAPNSELNSLTMGGVGRRTVLEYIQCSYGNDDSFEWFGGTVNAKYLISTGCLDDDFDTDNGFSGKVQFGLSQRLRNRADASTSQAFESDNDANASFNQPFTSVIFSNMTCIGALQDTSWTAGNGITPNTYNSRFGAAVQIRRNSRMSLFNSVLIGYPRGIEIAQANTMNAANTDTVQVRNNSWFGIKNTVLNLAGGTPPATMTTDWIAKSSFSNTVDKSTPSAANIVAPFEVNSSFNPTPNTSAPYLNSASFTRDGIVTIDDPYFTRVEYRGAFRTGNNNPITHRWDLPWSSYEPNTLAYLADPNCSSVTSVDVLPSRESYIGVFPNPVTAQAVVRYENSESDFVRVTIFNAIGNEVTIVSQHIQQVAGIYEFTLDTTPLPNGMYYVRIMGNRSTKTIPFAVVR